MSFVASSVNLERIFIVCTPIYYTMSYLMYVCNGLTAQCFYCIIRCVCKVVVHLDLRGAAKSAVYRDRPRTLNELKLQQLRS
jgi:hypothetical protein